MELSRTGSAQAGCCDGFTFISPPRTGDGCLAPPARVRFLFPVARCPVPFRSRHCATRCGGSVFWRATRSPQHAVQRQTAGEVIAQYTNWGGLNLREEALGAYLCSRMRAHDYTLVTAVLTHDDLAPRNRDDVAAEALRPLSVLAVIAMARDPAVRMLRLMKDEMTDWWSWWVADEEQRLGRLIAAVLGDPGTRMSGTGSYRGGQGSGEQRPRDARPALRRRPDGGRRHPARPYMGHARGHREPGRAWVADRYRIRRHRFAGDQKSGRVRVPRTRTRPAARGRALPDRRRPPVRTGRVSRPLASAWSAPFSACRTATPLGR
jgi:hypothetical protein